MLLVTLTRGMRAEMSTVSTPGCSDTNAMAMAVMCLDPFQPTPAPGWVNYRNGCAYLACRDVDAGMCGSWFPELD